MASTCICTHMHTCFCAYSSSCLCKGLCQFLANWGTHITPGLVVWSLSTKERKGKRKEEKEISYPQAPQGISNDPRAPR